MMRTVANYSTAHNGILSDETRTGISEKYLRLHAPCSEERIAAVLQAATEAAESLFRFQMTMRGDLIPELKAGALGFRKASEDSALERCGDIMRRVLKEADL